MEVSKELTVRVLNAAPPTFLLITMIGFKTCLKPIKGGHAENVDILYLKEKEPQKLKLLDELLENVKKHSPFSL